MVNFKKQLYLITILLLVLESKCKKSDKGEKPGWAKKDIRDYNEADMERLLEQWEASKENL
jgi:hypothetical protein